MEDYEAERAYYGAVCGRVANRICEGKFTLNGVDYQLAINNGPNHLHGGATGFSHKVWKSAVKDDKLVLTMESADGEENYPGNLTLNVTYSWSEDNEIGILYEATCDQDTLLNVTNHTYFNLDGENYGSTLDHTVKIAADRVTVTDEFLQATGEILDVAGSRFDLRSGKSFRQIISENPSGFDDNFIIGDAYGVFRKNAAVVTAGHSGISMAVHTTAPGIQFYMGGFLNEDGKSRYLKHSGFCLETQNWPNAVNMPCFPSVRIEPGKGYHSISCYAFSTGKDIQ